MTAIALPGLAPAPPRILLPDYREVGERLRLPKWARPWERTADDVIGAAVTVTEIGNIASSTSGQTTWVSPQFSPNVGDVVLALVGTVGSATTISTVADSVTGAPNSYAKIIGAARGTSAEAEMWAFHYSAAETGIGVTVTWASAVNERLGKLVLVSGLTSATPDTASAGGTSGVAKIVASSFSNGPAPGSMAPTSADFVVAFIVGGNTTITTPPSGYTIIGADLHEATRVGMLSAYQKTQSATGAENPTWTLSSSQSWAAIQAAFGVAAAAQVKELDATQAQTATQTKVVSKTFIP